MCDTCKTTDPAEVAKLTAAYAELQTGLLNFVAGFGSANQHGYSGESALVALGAMADLCREEWSPATRGNVLAVAVDLLARVERDQPGMLERVQMSPLATQPRVPSERIEVIKEREISAALSAHGLLVGHTYPTAEAEWEAAVDAIAQASAVLAAGLLAAGFPIGAASLRGTGQVAAALLVLYTQYLTLHPGPSEAAGTADARAVG